MSLEAVPTYAVSLPVSTLSGFVDFLSSAMPHGEVYLFGGVLRDLALFGRRGFHSDVDIVVEGSWSELERFLDRLGARKNKFGGYRLFAGDWPIDVWNAEDTWAVRQGLVRYDGVSSLVKTTVLNWDSILMNWRTGAFICSPEYLNDLQERSLDVVLIDNPNPIGMAVRVLRHLSSKEARRVGSCAVEYLESATRQFSFENLSTTEWSSYRSHLIEPALYRLFSLSRDMEGSSPERRFNAAAKEMARQGDGISWQQLELAISK